MAPRSPSAARSERARVHAQAAVLAAEEHGLVQAPGVDPLEQRLLVFLEAQPGHAAPELRAAEVRADVRVGVAPQQLAGLDLSGDQALEVGDFVERVDVWRLDVVVGLWRRDRPPLLDRWPAVLGIDLLEDAQLRRVCREVESIIPLGEVEGVVDPDDSLDALER